MIMLTAAVATFLAIHFLVSGTSLRDRVTGAIGEGPYMGLFSLASIAALVWIVIAFGPARNSPQNVSFWGIGHANRDPAILLVFIAVYILLRVAAGALTRRIHQTSALGGADRIVGAGFGAARALVVLGLVNLTINAIMPPDRMPPWISGALLYPVSTVSASALKAFAPRGANLAKQVYPVVGKAITSGGQDNETGAADEQNRDYNDPQTNAPGSNAPRLRVEKTP